MSLRRLVSTGCLTGLLFAACMPQGGMPEEPGGTGGAPPAATGGNPAPAPAGTGGTPPAPPPPPPATGGAPATPPPAGTGGSAPASDAGSVEPPPPPADAAPPPPPANGTADPESNYTCTRYYGINATAEWYGAGFEQIVDNARWELVRVHSGFIEKWAEPNNAFWNTNPTSPCAGGAKPDRVIFVGLNFDIPDKEFWVKNFTAVVNNLKAKFPGIKRIELASFVRGPGNKACPQREAKRSTIYPGQDEGIAEVVATDPVLLRASPKFEVGACSDFSGNPPHMSGAGGKNVAKKIGEYYAGKTTVQ